VIWWAQWGGGRGMLMHHSQQQAWQHLVYQASTAILVPAVAAAAGRCEAGGGCCATRHRSSLSVQVWARVMRYKDERMRTALAGDSHPSPYTLTPCAVMLPSLPAFDTTAGVLLPSTSPRSYSSPHQTTRTAR
jgi:hypothetical protein